MKNRIIAENYWVELPIKISDKVQYCYLPRGFTYFDFFLCPGATALITFFYKKSGEITIKDLDGHLSSEKISRKQCDSIFYHILKQSINKTLLKIIWRLLRFLGWIVWYSGIEFKAKALESNTELYIFTMSVSKEETCTHLKCLQVSEVTDSLFIGDFKSILL